MRKPAISYHCLKAGTSSSPNAVLQLLAWKLSPDHLFILAFCSFFRTSQWTLQSKFLFWKNSLILKKTFFLVHNQFSHVIQSLANLISHDWKLDFIVQFFLKILCRIMFSVKMKNKIFKSLFFKKSVDIALKKKIKSGVIPYCADFSEKFSTRSPQIWNQSKTVILRINSTKVKISADRSFVTFELV